jgi:hypothetical protein
MLSFNYQKQKLKMLSLNYQKQKLCPHRVTTYRFSLLYHTPNRLRGSEENASNYHFPNATHISQVSKLATVSTVLTHLQLLDEVR